MVYSCCHHGACVLCIQHSFGSKVACAFKTGERSCPSTEAMPVVSVTFWDADASGNEFGLYSHGYPSSGHPLGEHWQWPRFAVNAACKITYELPNGRQLVWQGVQGDMFVAPHPGSPRWLEPWFSCKRAHGPIDHTQPPPSARLAFPFFRSRSLPPPAAAARPGAQAVPPACG